MPQRSRVGRGISAIVAAAALELVDVSASRAGNFIVEFRDVVEGTGVGFDDHTLLSAPHACGATTLGQLRRCTAQRALDDLGSLITFAPGAAPDIRFLPSLVAGAAPVGVASGFYSTSLGNPQGGYLYQHITTGVDGSPGPDANITMNFGAVVNGIPAIINPDYSVFDPVALDLYTVVLHEGLHALGVASLIGPGGESTLTGATTGPYSRFDQYLVTGATPTHLVSGSPPTFAGTSSMLTSNVLDYLAPNTIARLPILSPSPFLAGASLSHFDRNRPIADAADVPYAGVHFDYLMGSGLPVRSVSEVEKDVLCNLGYDLGPLCSNAFPIGINDVGPATTPGVPMAADVLANDLNDALAIVPAPDLVILNGNGSGASATIDGGTIHYTPPATFVGTAAIRYRPTDGLRTGNTALLTVPVSGSYCPEDPCNLVCNGSFESGAPTSEISGVYTIAACPSMVDNWCPLGGTPDLYARGAPSNFNAIPTELVGESCGGVDTWDAPNPTNNRFVGMVSAEGAYAPLVNPLVAGATYRLQMRTITAAYAVTPNPGPAQLVIGFLSQAPGTFDLQLPIQISPLCDGSGTWSLVDVVFVAPTSSMLRYIGFYPQSNSVVCFVDDVRLVREEPLVTVTTSVEPADPQIGESVTFTIQACNAGNMLANNVKLSQVLPDGLVPTGGSFNYPTHTIPAIPPGGCTTLEVVARVTSTTPVGLALATCVSLDAGGLQCGASGGIQCASLTIPPDGRICGTVWNDANCDNELDGTEFPFAGRTITLTRPDGSSTTTSTNVGGQYCFENLAPGIYALAQDLPVGDRQIFPPTLAHQIDLAAGMLANPINFTSITGPHVCGFVWNDLSCDGLPNAGEPGIEGREVVLHRPDNSTVTAFTDGEGHYCFDLSLAVGSYSVTQSLEGWVQTHPATTAHTIVVAECGNQIVGSIDFGSAPAPRICGVTWNDLNCDGRQNGGETVIPGVDITLHRPDNTTITVATGSDGKYCFDLLPAGNYTVTQAVPGQLVQTHPVTPEHTVDLTLCATPSTNAIDFGSGPAGHICGVVWNDLDCDGVLDAVESGVQGRDVVLHRPDNTTVTVATDPDGHYCFQALPSGAYTVTQIVPGSSVQTYPDMPAHAFDVIGCGSVDNANFGTKTTSGQVVSPSKSMVVPWGQSGFVLVSPGTQSAVDEVVITVRDENGCPITGSTVSVHLGDCEELCVDSPNGLAGVTDYLGQARLNPRVGGCAVCPVRVLVDGVLIATFTRVVSPDWDGTRADGRVDCADVAFFEGAFGSGDYVACADLNNDGVVSIPDVAIMAAAAIAGDENEVHCGPAPVTQQVVVDCGGAGGAITVTPASLVVSPGQRVEWKMAGDCATLCGSGTGAVMEIDPAVGLFPDGWTSLLGSFICSPIIPANAAAGTYKYSVGVYAGGSLCPEVPNNPLDPYLVIQSTTGTPSPVLPRAFAFSRAPRPNPTQAEVGFSITLPEPRDVEVSIFDPAGRRVAELHRGALPAGEHAFVWRGVTSSGKRASTGMYVLKVRAGNATLSRQIVLLR